MLEGLATELSEVEACALADQMGDFGDVFMQAWARLARRLPWLAGHPALLEFMPHRDRLDVVVTTHSDASHVRVVIQAKLHRHLYSLWAVSHHGRSTA